jgi:AraC family cel operon transcriptional repressor
MNKQCFELKRFLRDDDEYHIAQVEIHSKEDLSPHTHAYAELFWVVRGAGVHCINGQEQKITTGDLAMIRPCDEHTFYSKNSGLTIINIAFPSSTLEAFRSRYFATSRLYFWTPSVLPFHLILSKERLHRLTQRAKDAMQYRRSLLQLDSLLLFIFRQLIMENSIEHQEQLPLWFSKAIHQYNVPFYFQQGIKGFVELCGRNVDYINRISQRYFNQSLTVLINSYKLQYAATQLTITNMPIKEIAVNCGYTNLSYFYHLFKQHYHQTPKQYRRTMQLVV